MSKPNLIQHADLNHRVWDDSFRYLTKISPEDPPESVENQSDDTNDTSGTSGGTTGGTGVVTFRNRGLLGYFYSFDPIAPTDADKTYTLSIWGKTQVPDWIVQGLRINQSGKRYNWMESINIPPDGAWHRISWTYMNDHNTHGLSIGFSLRGQRDGKYSLFGPRLVEGEGVDSEQDSEADSEEDPGSESDSEQDSDQESDSETGETGGGTGETGETGGGTGGGTGEVGATGGTGTAQSTVTQTIDIAKMYAEKVNATVNIAMRAENGQYFSGSGFFVSKDGYIVTAAHVVTHGATPAAYATQVWVHYYPENQVVQAQIIGVDRLYDVALLKAPVTNRIFLEFTDSRETPIGSDTVAIGQPLGNHVQSITRGIVMENKGQDYSWMAESVLADFEIVGGNSGGPVLNSEGRVIGIVSWGLTQGAYSLNGAIASYPAKRIIEKIQTIKGDYPASYIGISFTPMDIYDVIFRNLSTKVEGVLVSNVVAGSPAAQAGLVSGDIITHCNDRVLGNNNNQEPLGTLIHLADHGIVLSLRLLRADGSHPTLHVTTIPLPSEYDYIFSDKYTIQQLHSGEKQIFT